MGAQISSPPKKFGSWLSRTSGTIYRADTDGFVTAYKNAVAGNNLKGETEAATPPTVVRTWQQGVGAGEIGISFPVRKADYWRVTGVGGEVVFWIPLETA